MIIRRFLTALLVLMACGCGTPEPVTVPGPESDALLPTAKGFIVVDQPAGGIKAIQLPTLRGITVRPSGPGVYKDMPTIHMLSGPDDQGRIAYIEDHFFVDDDRNRRHLLKTIRLDGTDDTVLFTRPGDAMWAGTGGGGHADIGHTISLAPTGGHVAFLSRISALQMPSALLIQGRIEIWNINEKTGTKTDIQALDEGFSWLPDGKHLVYVKMVDPAGNPNAADPNDPIAHSFLQWKWDQIPAVFIRDVQAQTEVFVHMGWKPIVSVDGKKVLLSDRDSSFYCIELATGKTSPLTGPGKAWPLAMLDTNTLLALCVPTVGAEVKFTQFYSPIGRGPQELLAVKITKTDSPAIQTVYRDVDPRDEISFGLGTETGGK